MVEMVYLMTIRDLSTVLATKVFCFAFQRGLVVLSRMVKRRIFWLFCLIVGEEI